ncbi:hypothetical protein [Rhodohalobacter sp.]|uniref:hypothetical protein n=1 Tax=Rhodohalobacter sp. TaxID=1974210 RepID=UPI002ACEB912|nr:hypothetical protein [Rhodohalobacter sp.]
MTSNFTTTGDTYSALPEGYPVKVVLTGLDDEIEYEEIGALQVKQSDMNDLSKAVEFAKKKARERAEITHVISKKFDKFNLNHC